MPAIRLSTLGTAVTTPDGAPASTTLDMVLPGVPWSAELQLGWGVNALTGQGADLALRPFDVKPASVINLHSQHHQIFNSEQLSSTVSAAVSGSYSIQGSTILASASFLDTVRLSSTSATMLWQLEWIADDYEMADAPEFNPAALKLLKDDPERFREHYGDYFVQGQRRGARMLVVCNASASTREQIRQFGARVSGAMPNVFSMEGATELKHQASESQVSLSITADYVGVPRKVDWRLPGSLEEVPGVKDWFMQVSEGVPLMARLMHYAALDSACPRRVDVPPDRFVELQSLMRLSSRVGVLARSLPSPYQAEYETRATDLATRITAHEASLPRDFELIQRLHDEARALETDIGRINRRDAVFEAGMEGRREEPAPGERQSAEERRTVRFGHARANEEEAVVEHYRPVEVGGAFLQHREHVWDERFPGQVILGWSVEVYWGDSGEWWRSDEQHIIGSDHFVLRCRSDLSRGFSYRVRIYTVPRALYQFDLPSD